MTTLRNSAEGQVTGTAATAANTGGSSGTAFDDVTATATCTFTFDSTHGGAHGSMAYKMVLGATAGESYAQWDTTLVGLSTVRTLWGETYGYMTANPSSTFILFRFMQGSNLCGVVRINTTGHLEIADFVATTQATMATAITLNQWVRIEAKCIGDPGTGALECKLFNTKDSATATETISATGINTAGQVDKIRTGHSGTPVANVTIWLDDVGGSTEGYLGALTTITDVPSGARCAGFTNETTQQGASDVPSGARAGTSPTGVKAIEDAIGVQFVADAETPAAYLAYDGQVYLLPTALFSQVGSGPISPGHLVGVWGYRAPGGPTGNRWVMSSIIPSPLGDQIELVPGPAGWTFDLSRYAFRSVTELLMDRFAVPGADVVTMLSDLYAAAKTNAQQFVADTAHGWARAGDADFLGITAPDILVFDDIPSYQYAGSSPADVTVA